MFRLDCSWQAGGTRVNRVEWLRYPPILPGMIYSLIYLTDEACNFMHRSMRSAGSPWQYNGAVTLPKPPDAYPPNQISVRLIIKPPLRFYG